MKIQLSLEITHDCGNISLILKKHLGEGPIAYLSQLTYLLNEQRRVFRNL